MKSENVWRQFRMLVYINYLLMHLIHVHYIYERLQVKSENNE